MARDNLHQNNIQKLWASGIVHPESKQILSYIRRNRYTPFETLDVNQLYKDTIEFGQSAAGAILTQIARYPSSTNLLGCQIKASFPHSHTESQDP